MNARVSSIVSTDSVDASRSHHPSLIPPRRNLCGYGFAFCHNLGGVYLLLQFQFRLPRLRQQLRGGEVGRKNRIGGI